MEQKKYHLQKEILKALKANDSDLYSLLKSQWAHRFGVESLEELENLDLNHLNQNPNNLNNQTIDQSQENSLEGDEGIQMQDDTQGKEIKTKEFEPIKDENNESFQFKSNKNVDKGNHKDLALNPVCKNKNSTGVKALIPLPPKPKYGYLNKWLLRK